MKRQRLSRAIALLVDIALVVHSKLKKNNQDRP